MTREGNNDYDDNDNGDDGVGVVVRDPWRGHYHNQSLANLWSASTATNCYRSAAFNNHKIVQFQLIDLWFKPLLFLFQFHLCSLFPHNLWVFSIYFYFSQIINKLYENDKLRALFPPSIERRKNWNRRFVSFSWPKLTRLGQVHIFSAKVAEFWSLVLISMLEE